MVKSASVGAQCDLGYSNRKMIVPACRLALETVSFRPLMFPPYESESNGRCVFRCIEVRRA